MVHVREVVLQRGKIMDFRVRTELKSSSAIYKLLDESTSVSFFKRNIEMGIIKCHKGLRYKGLMHDVWQMINKQR